MAATATAAASSPPPRLPLPSFLQSRLFSPVLAFRLRLESLRRLKGKGREIAVFPWMEKDCPVEEGRGGAKRISRANFHSRPPPPTRPPRTHASIEGSRMRREAEFAGEEEGIPQIQRLASLRLPLKTSRARMRKSKCESASK